MKVQGRLEKAGLTGGQSKSAWVKLLNLLCLLDFHALIKIKPEVFQVSLVFLPAKILISNVYWLVLSPLPISGEYGLCNVKTPRYISQFCCKGNS